MLTRFIDWFWRDRQTGRIVIAQWPNLWLWIFAAASLVELITNAAGPIGIGAHIVSTTSLLSWAGDELLRGANPWRRCLGIAVLIGLTIRLSSGFGANRGWRSSHEQVSVTGSSRELTMTKITAPQSPTRVPWNRGRIIGPKPPLKPKHIWAIRTRLQHDGHVRDLAMFNVAIDSKLRGCDRVKLRVSDVYLGEGVRLRTTIVQQKTGRPVPFEITEPTRDALMAWLKKRGSRSSDWLFPSRSHAGDHITTRQYGRLVDDWVALAGLDPASYGTHSLRRTKVALVYKRTGNLRACQLLLGHSKLESTVRYLGVEVDDALILSEQTDL